MKMLPKIFLPLSLLTLAISLTPAGAEIGWGILRPVGAVFFVLFMISTFLEGIEEESDQEKALKMARAQPYSDRLAKPATSRPATMRPTGLRPANM